MDETVKAPRHDIAALSALIILLVDAAKLGAEAKADGSLSLADGILLLKLFPDLGPAFAKIGEVPAELGDLDPAEAQQLITLVTGRLAGSQSEKAAHVTGKALALALSRVELVQAIRE
jgi:hypothetical protein